jgi:hypothetical protein
VKLSTAKVVWLSAADHSYSDSMKAVLKRGRQGAAATSLLNSHRLVVIKGRYTIFSSPVGGL